MLLGAEPDEHGSVVGDRPIGHVAAEDTAEPSLVSAAHVRIRHLRVELAAIRLGPAHHSLLVGHGQGLPAGDVVGPLLEEQDGASGTGAPWGNEGDCRSVEQAWVLRTIHETGEVTIMAVGPARGLLGNAGELPERLDRLACLVEDDVVGTSRQPQQGVVLSRGHHKAAGADHRVVKAADTLRHPRRRERAPQLRTEPGDQVHPSQGGPRLAKAGEPGDEAARADTREQVELQVGVRGRPQGKDPALWCAHRSHHGPSDPGRAGMAGCSLQRGARGYSEAPSLPASAASEAAAESVPRSRWRSRPASAAALPEVTGGAPGAQGSASADVATCWDADVSLAEQRWICVADHGQLGMSLFTTYPSWGRSTLPRVEAIGL